LAAAAHVPPRGAYHGWVAPGPARAWLEASPCQAADPPLTLTLALPPGRVPVAGLAGDQPGGPTPHPVSGAAPDPAAGVPRPPPPPPVALSRGRVPVAGLAGDEPGGPTPRPVSGVALDLAAGVPRAPAAAPPEAVLDVGPALAEALLGPAAGAAAPHPIDTPH